MCSTGSWINDYCFDFEDLPLGTKNIEILSLVLYTGPMFVLYRGLPRGFGDCGSVQHILDFWSTDGKFEKQLKRRTVNNRMTGAGHKFSSKNHCLVRAVKKLQRLTSGVQGTWLYRGLGGLDIQAFIEANSFTEKGILNFEGGASDLGSSTLKLGG